MRNAILAKGCEREKGWLSPAEGRDGTFESSRALESNGFAAPADSSMEKRSRNSPQPFELSDKSVSAN